jgi:hypothetical protein
MDRLAVDKALLHIDEPNRQGASLRESGSMLIKFENILIKKYFWAQ